LARRTLIVFRRLRRALASFAVWAVALHTAGAFATLPANASENAAAKVDPVVAGLLRHRASVCGLKPGQNPPDPYEDPPPVKYDANQVALVIDTSNAPTILALQTPSPPRPVYKRQASFVLASATSDVAQQPLPAPSQQGAQDAPAPVASLPSERESPSPSASPSLVPIPPVPAGPGQLLPPTPRSTGAATPTPVPLPTVSPTAVASGPIFLVRPSGTPAPIVPVGASPASSPSASPGPSSSASAGQSSSPGPAASPLASPPVAGGNPAPVPTTAPTLGPYQIVAIADRIAGSSEPHQPSDLLGNVHVFYTAGQIVGDKAHYDGDHTILMSGHTYLVNRTSDSILYADQISFDTLTRRATLINGAGETIEGVQQGKLHFSARNLTTTTDGVSHGDRASFTTCENPHGGYHIEARTIDVTPGQRLVARKAVVFLGPTAIFYLPLLVIPLRSVDDPRRQASFIPIIGYDQLEGFYIKARIGFGTSNTYYGYYRVEYYTKRGLGLGYTAVAGSKDGRRYLTVDSYTINDRIANARETNVDLQETENYSARLRSQVGVTYQGDYGPNLQLPATLNVQGSLIHQGNASTENFTFSRFTQGSLSNNLNLGFVDSINLSQQLQQQLNLSYSKFASPLSSTNTFHINTDTHLFTKFADYNLTYDKTDYSSNPFGYDRVPELQVLPHLTYGGFRFGPQLQFTAGEYTEPQNHFSTQRVQGQLNEAVYFKVLGNSDFTANYNLTQDYYGTGDLKAYDQQNAALTTPIANHIVNAVTYNEQHPIGPPDVPFQLLDRLSTGSKSAQDVIRFFNQDYYSLSLAATTNFDRMAQPINYQFNWRPSLRSYLTIGGYYGPGPGNGFGLTNVQAITPFGRDTTLELTTNVDWKNKGALIDKNIYLTRTIDNCYNLQFAYNQDLKTFNFNIVILAFPGQSAGFGFGGTSSTQGVIPQSFANL